MSPGKLLDGGGKPYLYIINGNLCRKVDKTTEGAKLREYELPNGTKGSKYELVYRNWESKIIGLEFKEGDYGEQCYIQLEDAIITLNTSARHFTDFASKVFSGNLADPYLFHPFDIETTTGHKKGISLQQGGVKLKNYFYDYDKKIKINGFPEVDESKKEKKTYWKIYFAEVTEFLVDKLKQIKFEDKIKDEPLVDFAEDVEQYDYKDDLPFS